MLLGLVRAQADFAGLGPTCCDVSVFYKEKEVKLQIQVSGAWDGKGF
jgi:hypothetical protein